MRRRRGQPLGGLERLVQLAFDVVVMALAFTVVGPSVVGYSIIGAVVLNLFVLINHRSDRYIALR